MSNNSRVPESYNKKVWSMSEFYMISKEGKRFDGYVKDDKGNYMYVISKPEHILKSNAGETLFEPELRYTYMFFKLAPEGIGCWVWRETKKHLFFDRNLKASQEAVTKEYGANVHYIPEASSLKVKDPVTKEIVEVFTVFIGDDRKGYVVNKNGVTLPNNITVKTDNGTTIFATSDDSLNPGTLYRNMFGSSYIGSDNPKKYSKEDDYSFAPESAVEWGAYQHDLRYDKAKAAGKNDAFTNTNVFWADVALVGSALGAMPVDLLTATDGSSRWENLKASVGITVLFGGIATFKAVKTPVDKSNRKVGEAMVKNYRPPMPHSPF